MVILPPVVKIAGPLPGSEAAVKHDKPQIHKPEELERYLIGTRWNYYKNANFFGEPTVLEFTAPGKATMDGKEFAWRVLDKARIGFEDKHEFTFSKNYDEFTGTWIPNPVDKKSARLIQP